jgi:hypothetical protein
MGPVARGSGRKRGRTAIFRTSRRECRPEARVPFGPGLVRQEEPAYISGVGSLSDFLQHIDLEPGLPTVWGGWRGWSNSKRQDDWLPMAAAQ